MQQFALQLKNANPQAWDAFVECMDVYAAEVTLAMTAAPQNEILNYQGRAQQCLALLRMFRECALVKASPTEAPQN
ncbi:MAG TPA: hypothetical protein VIJ94_03565 [Caulobacteraceae bacterium]